MEPVGPTAKPTIFKVKRSLEEVNPTFCLFLCAIFHGFLVIQNFDFDLAAKSSHFQGQTSPRAGKFPILLIFVTFVKTLALEPVGPYRQTGPFSRLTIPRAGKPPILPIFMCYNSWIFGDPNFRRQLCINFSLTLIFGNPEFRRHFCQKNSWTSDKTLDMEPIGPHGQTVPFSRLTNPRVDLSYGVSWSPLPNRPFQRPNEPSAGKPSILPIFVCYSPWIFGDSEFRRYLCEKILWTSVKTLAMEPVGPHGQTRPFSRSNKLQSK
ncbi:hypothetical protein H5410_013773 [Solanum commersonii]|uniref:Uncharacterized protein n=1 Tax=Solanum commersonii TaxID=4109 RepID=A0A9J5ZP30_SOLCO|nr:hypothetical protein H5410_013773 [Solanum commersonii]